MSLTLVEEKMLEALETVAQYLTAGKATKKEYYECMTAVRDGLKAGHNKKHGCPSGVHSGYCTCKETQPGMSASYLKYRKKRG